MALLEQLRRLRKNLELDDRKARSRKADPRDAHDAERRAEEARVKIKQTEAAIDADRELIAKLETVADQLEADAFKSRCRAVAITKLEEAAMWLRKEVGHD